MKPLGKFNRAGNLTRASNSAARRHTSGVSGICESDIFELWLFDLFWPLRMRG